LTIPVYVVTGFLDAGKTTFLNGLLGRHNWRDVQTLVIQFETGEEEFKSQYKSCRAINFPKRVLEQQPEQIVAQLRSHILSGPVDEIWIEWNGVTPFSRLQGILLHPLLRKLCKLNKVIHAADAGTLENLLIRTGGVLPEQISSCDFVVLRNAYSVRGFKRVRRILRSINPGVEIYDTKSYSDLCKRLFRRKEHPINVFFLLIAFFIILYFSFRPVFEQLQIPVNAITNVFLGIMLQAVPFLLIGVLLSSAIQVFVSREAIERRFPKSFGKGALVAILGGFCLPVCDCASIPIFRSLVKKGIPIPTAVIFMTVTPIINPVVILSTWYAFGSVSIVVGRMCFGIIAAVLIGLAFAILPPKGEVLSGGVLDGLMCSCGCYEDVEAAATIRGKLDMFMRHSQAEFFNVGKYLVIGTFVSSVFQTMGTGIFTAQSGAGRAVSLVVMMLMAFVLSLCSSSDAVVARSFNSQFPLSAIMGFLVFGPMMDIKNVMMLSSGFSKPFIARLLFTAFIVCFAVVFLLTGLGGI